MLEIQFIVCEIIHQGVINTFANFENTAKSAFLKQI